VRICAPIGMGCVAPCLSPPQCGIGVHPGPPFFLTFIPTYPSSHRKKHPQVTPPHEIMADNHNALREEFERSAADLNRTRKTARHKRRFSDWSNLLPGQMEPQLCPEILFSPVNRVLIEVRVKYVSPSMITTVPVTSNSASIIPDRSPLSWAGQPCQWAGGECKFWTKLRCVFR
jgi:hypothetical protein